MTTPQTSPVDDQETMAGVEYRMPEPMRLDSQGDLLPKWLQFKQQFQIFLTAAGFDRFSEARKAAIFLNSVGHEVQELYFNVLKTDESTKYEQIIKILDDFFEPKQNEIISTYCFHKRNQVEGESFDLFYTEIRKLVKNCNFKEQEERMIRDRIVLGVQDQKLQRKFLEINNLTLQTAVDMCRASELSNNHSKMMHQKTAVVDIVQSTPATEVHQSAGTKAKYTSNKDSKYSYTCKKCRTQHGPRNCPAFGKICSHCQKPNHFKKGCKLLNEIRVLNSDSQGDKDNNVHNL